MALGFQAQFSACRVPGLELRAYYEAQDGGLVSATKELKVAALQIVAGREDQQQTQKWTQTLIKT